MANAEQDLFERAARAYELGRLAEAEVLLQKLLVQRADHPDTLRLLGLIAHRAGKSADAVDLIRRAIALNPSEASYHASLGVVLASTGEIEPAAAALRHVVSLRPDWPEAHYNLGNVLRMSGQADDAIIAYRNAINLRPNDVHAHNKLGITLQEKGDLPGAIHAYRRAIAAQPNHAEAFNNLASALQEHGELDGAIDAYDKSIKLRPDTAEIHGNLGVALKEVGRLDEAIAESRRAVALAPHPRLASSLLFTLHFHPDTTPRQLFDEHRRWNETFAKPLAAEIRPHGNEPSPDRRLRIGYVSADFNEHPVGRFIAPLLANHHSDEFEVCCYSDVRRPDALTESLRSCADVWRDTAALSDARLADVIRDDRIDILVDLSMHARHNRMLLFARKPAPVQVTYLAYSSATGLDAMDYRLTDPYLDPPGGDESVYAERAVWLPHTYWCYQSPPDAGDPGPLPAMWAGYVTFGCLNNYSKVTPQMLGTWGRLMRGVPGSRLVLHSPEGSHRQRARDILARHAIDPAQLEFVARVPRARYFDQYRRLDIALDPYPFGGGATTCDALWMGVPVVSLRGQTAVSRAGLSILSNVGVAELVADDPEQYVRIASDLGQDLGRLVELRSTLRARMLASPLMNASEFARDVESALRQMWRSWCVMPR